MADATATDLIPVDLAVRPASPLTKAQARRLTGDIKRRLGDLQARADTTREAIAQAYRDKAWAPLGYVSWAQYVASEFAEVVGRRQTYRIIDWVEATAALTEAAGERVELSLRDVAAIKPAGVADVAADVAEQVAAGAPAGEAVAKAVKGLRGRGGVVPRGMPAQERPADGPGSAQAAPEPNQAPTTAQAGPVPGEARQAATPAVIAGRAIEVLLGVDPGEAVDVPPSSLAAVTLWVEQVRAAILRRMNSTAAAVPPATNTGTAATTPQVVGPPTGVADVIDVAVTDRADITTATVESARRCPHPVNRRMGSRCLACGQPAT